MLSMLFNTERMNLWSEVLDRRDEKEPHFLNHVPHIQRPWIIGDGIETGRKCIIHDVILFRVGLQDIVC